MTINAEQKHLRGFGLGGSDAGTVLGLSPYKTPFQLYLEKSGQADPADLDHVEAVAWGNRLEALVADEFTRQTGMKAGKVNRTIIHRTLPFMLANIDRRIVGRPELLEVKTTRSLDGDAPRADHVAQVLHYLAVTGWKRGHLAYLIAGQNFKHYIIERDDAAITGLEQLEAEFWRSVINRTPPPPVNVADLKFLYPVDDGNTVTASDEVIVAVENLAQLKASIKALEAEAMQAEQRVMEYMGSAAELRGADGRSLITWKSTRPVRTLDRSRLEAERPEIAEQYMVERPGSRRFLVKVSA